MSKVRNSNIELLRCVLILMVIVLHYNQGQMGGALRFVEGHTINKFLVHFMESLSICAVNVFIIISGYFLVNNSKRSIAKPIGLLLLVSAYQIILYLAFCLLGYESFSTSSLLVKILPANWYIILYSVLYLISPLLNIVIHHLKTIELRKTIFYLLILFSVIMSIIDITKSLTGLQGILGLSTISMYDMDGGYTIVNFVLLYFIGGFLQLNKEVKYKPVNQFVLYVIVALLMTMISYFTTKVWNYNNILVILESIFLFNIFNNLKMKPSRIINYISKSVLGIYIIHGILLYYVWDIPLINVAAQGSPITFVLNITYNVLFLAVVSFAAEKIGNILTIWVPKVSNIVRNVLIKVDNKINV